MISKLKISACFFFFAFFEQIGKKNDLNAAFSKK